MTIAALSYRIMNEPDFYHRLVQNMDQTLAEAKLELDQNERIALKGFLTDPFALSTPQDADELTTDPWFPT